MAYILGLLDGSDPLSPDHISLERYVTENALITKYLGRVVKATPLTVYRILFHLTYFETGKDRIKISWSEIGRFMVSDRRKRIEYASTVKRRMKDLREKKCITVNRVKHSMNEIIVRLPSNIPLCASLIEQEHSASNQQEVDIEKVDFYNREHVDVLLDRENHQCFYCVKEIEPNTCQLDHVESRDGDSYRNIVASCNICNSKKSDMPPEDFLRSLLRSNKLSDEEFDARLKALEELQAGNLRPVISH